MLEDFANIHRANNFSKDSDHAIRSTSSYNSCSDSEAYKAV